VQFLQDLTGSFGDDIASVRGLVPQIVSALQAVQVDSRFGVTSFVDKPVSPFGATGEWVYDLELGLTANAAALASTYKRFGDPLRRGRAGGADRVSHAGGPCTRSRPVSGRTPPASSCCFTDAPYHKAGDGVGGWHYDAPTTATTRRRANGALEDYPLVQQVRAAIEAANIIPIFAIAQWLRVDLPGTCRQPRPRHGRIAHEQQQQTSCRRSPPAWRQWTTTHIEDAVGGVGSDHAEGQRRRQCLVGGRRQRHAVRRVRQRQARWRGQQRQEDVRRCG
jgi:hypothetical protein